MLGKGNDRYISLAQPAFSPLQSQDPFLMSQTKNVLSPNLRLGIVGHGFVGSAVSSAFQNVRTQVFLVDPTLNTTIDELAKFGPDVVFVSVPTPMGESGNIDDSIVLSVVQQLLATDCPLIALKSTVTPKVIEKLWDLPRC